MHERGRQLFSNTQVKILLEERSIHGHLQAKILEEAYEYCAIGYIDHSNRATCTCHLPSACFSVHASMARPASSTPNVRM
jgi:hypothetical protein